jgi:hypothetical protein
MNLIILIMQSILLGDIALTYEGFIAVAGELGTGHTDIVWHFL